MQLLLLTALVVVGYINLSLLALFLEMKSAALPGAAAAVALIAVSPCLPLAAALMVRLTSWRLAGRLAATLAVLAGGCGALLGLLDAALSEGGWLVLVHGITLAAAVAAAVLMLSRSRFGQRSALVLLTAPALGAVWSLVVLGVVTLSANRISDGRPYCLAKPQAKGPVLSLADLRGFAFYTKDEWSFHGLLLVHDKTKTIAYNWSPRRMQFDQVLRPELLIADPRSQCLPQPNFLAGLPLASFSAE
jgi:hypothetical protein